MGDKKVTEEQIVDQVGDGYPDLPLPVDTLAKILEEAIDWAHAHGLVMRTRDRKDCSDICQNAPLALLPSAFPRQLFKQAQQVQQNTNLLYHRIAWDYDYIVAAHRDVIRTDQFTLNMLNIYHAIQKEGIRQKNSLLIQRADYMCHVDEENGDRVLRQVQKLEPNVYMPPVQVEVNNIAASMGALAQLVTQLHRRILRRLGVSPEQIQAQIPVNRPVDTVANGIYEAWLTYGDLDSVVLFVVEDVNQNQLDQRFIEYRLNELTMDRIDIFRFTLTECAQRLSLSKDGILLWNVDDHSTAPRRVAVVYFRSGYSPANYPSQSEWDARLTMERSMAIKCPWIGLQLANTKKIQQILTNPGEVEKFLDTEAADEIRASFAGLWGLEPDNPATAAVIKNATQKPDLFVLKPQLEGGGGNYYGEAVAEQLAKLNPDELAAHVLMERIRPLITKNYLVRALQPVQLEDVVGELGIYGYLLGDSDNIRANVSGGHILRTKGALVDEGGVAVGAAVIDSPWLI